MSFLQLKDIGKIYVSENNVAVGVRGVGYESEWASNVTLGQGESRDGEAQGFSEAADQVMNEIYYYLARHDLFDDLREGKVKFWVSGFSRAGLQFRQRLQAGFDKLAFQACAGPGLPGLPALRRSPWLTWIEFSCNTSSGNTPARSSRHGSSC